MQRPELKTAPEIRKEIETLDPEIKNAWDKFIKFNKDVDFRKDKLLVEAYGMFKTFTETLAEYKGKEKKTDYSEAIQSICLSIIGTNSKFDKTKIIEIGNLVDELKNFINNPNLAEKYADVKKELDDKKSDQARILDMEREEAERIREEAEKRSAQYAKRIAEVESRDKVLGDAKWLQTRLNSLSDLIKAYIPVLHPRFKELFVDHNNVLYDSKLSLEEKYDVINRRLKQFEDQNIEPYSERPPQEKEKKATKQGATSAMLKGAATVLGVAGAIISGGSSGLNALRGFTPESQNQDPKQLQKYIKEYLELSEKIRKLIERKLPKKKTSSSTAAIVDKVGGLAGAGEAKSPELTSGPDAGDAKRPSSSSAQSVQHDEKQVSLDFGEKTIQFLNELLNQNTVELKKGDTTFKEIKNAIDTATTENIFDNLAKAIKADKMETVLKEYRKNYLKHDNNEEKAFEAFKKPRYQFYYIINQIIQNRNDPNILEKVSKLMENRTNLDINSAVDVVRGKQIGPGRRLS